MDNADRRRGRPSTLKVFGEDVALLAIVALLARAQLFVARADQFRPEMRCELGAILAEAIGETGLTLGQLADLRAPSGAEPSGIARANHLKTGVLFIAAVDFATVLVEASPGDVARYRAFAEQLGQAYQMLDDFADGWTGTGVANERNSEDAGRITLLSRLGRDGAAARLRVHMDGALSQLVPGGPLRSFVERLFHLSPDVATKLRPSVAVA